MAIRWVSNAGTDDLAAGRGETEGDPWATHAHADTNTSDGDIINVTGATFVGELNGVSLLSERTYGAPSRHATVVLPNAGEATRVARFSSGLAAADFPVEFRDMILDANAGQVTQCMDSGNDATGSPLIRVIGVWFRGDPSNYHFFHQYQRDRLEMLDCKVSGVLPLQFLLGSGSASGLADQQYIIRDLELVNLSCSVTSEVVRITKAAAGVNELKAIIDHIYGVVEWTTAARTYKIVYIQGADVAEVSGLDLVINADDTVSLDSFGIHIEGRDAGTITPLGTANRNVIEFNCPVGHAIGLGSSTDAWLTAAEANGNVLTGKYYAVATPHLLSLRDGVDGKAHGNILREGAACLLISRCVDAAVTGNLIVDAYYAAILVKGADQGHASYNIIVHTGKHTQRDVGLLSCQVQLGQNTGGTAPFEYNENVVIVADPASINKLAYVGDINQVITYNRTTYILPDTYDPLTETDFGVVGVQDPATLAQWNALAGNTAVNDDEILLLPQAVVTRLANAHAIMAARAAGAGGGGGNSILTI